MNSEDFKKIIRTMIKEELEKQLPTLIPQVLTEILTGKSQFKNSLEQKIPLKQETTPPIIQKKYTSNPLLNQVLNETTIKIKQENSPNVGYSERLTKSISNIPSIDDGDTYGELYESVEPKVMDIVPVTEDQTKVLGKINRDFRGLMKAIDQKKNGGMLSGRGMVSIE